MVGDLVAGLAAVAAAVVLGLVLRRYVFFVTRVASGSMEPTLRAGQLLPTRRARRIRRIGRGDVVVVRSEDAGRLVVKRVVGLPGELVEIDGSGHVHVDGIRLEERYVAYPGGPRGTFRVPAGHLFLLGDNRARSRDGRLWKNPFTPVEAVQGRVGLRDGRTGRTQDAEPARPSVKGLGQADS